MIMDRLFRMYLSLEDKVNIKMMILIKNQNIKVLFKNKLIEQKVCQLLLMVLKYKIVMLIAVFAKNYLKKWIYRRV
jgi:hypothetical protein